MTHPASTHRQCLPIPAAQRGRETETRQRHTHTAFTLISSHRSGAQNPSAKLTTGPERYGVEKAYHSRCLRCLRCLFYARPACSCSPRHRCCSSAPPRRRRSQRPRHAATSSARLT
jgi:hypothetical protein